MAMARTMGRPASPPFALITVVVLFVISTVTAVALYLQWQKALKLRDDESARSKKVAAELESLRASHQLLLGKVTPEAARLAADAEAAKKVVKDIEDRLKSIKVDLNATDTFSGYKALDAIGQMENNRQQIFDQLKKANDKLLANAAEIKTLKDNHAALDTKVRDIEKDNVAERKTLMDRIDAEAAKAKAQIDQLTGDNKKLNDQLTDLKLQLPAKLAEKDQTISAKENEIRILRKTIEEMRGEPVLIDKVKWGPAKLADGTILQVVSEQEKGLVYLRLIRPEQARMGMRYVIHSKGKPIPNTGEGKATVEVSSLEGGSVQAKILKSVAGDPIIPGDLALNVVTGPRKFKFVVAGVFDLNNDGVAEPNGRAQIEGLISRWGGTVQENLDISTNFVVLGDQTREPPAPPAGADAMVIDNYNRQVAESKRWITASDGAARYNIPILNNVTFLHWIGYFNEDTAPGWEKRVRPGEDYFGS